jgi:hypothetical protein
VALNTITLTLPSILDCPSFFSNVFFSSYSTIKIMSFH